MGMYDKFATIVYQEAQASVKYLYVLLGRFRKLFTYIKHFRESLTRRDVPMGSRGGSSLIALINQRQRVSPSVGVPEAERNDRIGAGLCQEEVVDPRVTITAAVIVSGERAPPGPHRFT